MRALSPQLTDLVEFVLIAIECRSGRQHEITIAVTAHEQCQINAVIV